LHSGAIERVYGKAVVSGWKSRVLDGSVLSIVPGRIEALQDVFITDLCISLVREPDKTQLDVILKIFQV
jgi:hypothetical protein